MSTTITANEYVGLVKERQGLVDSQARLLDRPGLKATPRPPKTLEQVTREVLAREAEAERRALAPSEHAVEAPAPRAPRRPGTCDLQALEPEETEPDLVNFSAGEADDPSVPEVIDDRKDLRQGEDPEEHQEPDDDEHLCDRSVQSRSRSPRCPHSRIANDRRRSRWRGLAAGSPGTLNQCLVPVRAFRFPDRPLPFRVFPHSCCSDSRTKMVVNQLEIRSSHAAPVETTSVGFTPTPPLPTKVEVGMVLDARRC